MQFSVSTILMAAMALGTQATAISSRQVDTTIDLFNSAGCSNYQTTWTWSNEHGSNGGCQAISAKSARVTSLFGSCTVTVYTDSSCSNGATAARSNVCVTGNWNSFSVDSCA